jgi:hypothetical protein
VNKQYIDTYLSEHIQMLAIAALNDRPNDVAAFMRDYLLGIEHKPIQIDYDSVQDLKAIKEEVQSLKIRK